MDVTSATSVRAMPVQLRRKANQQKGRKNSGRMYQLRMLWWRAHAHEATSLSQSGIGSSPSGGRPPGFAALTASGTRPALEPVQG